MSLAPGKPGLGTSLFPSDEDEDEDLSYFDENGSCKHIKIPLRAGFYTGQSSESRVECALKAWLVS